MADFTTSDVASKVEAPKGMGLGDIMNLARNVQLYKQEQQVNPLKLQQEQFKTEEAKRTLEPRIAGVEAESRGKTLEIQKKVAGAINDIVPARMRDPRLAEYIKSGNKHGIMDLLAEDHQKLREMGLTEGEALGAISPIANVAISNPSQLPSVYQNLAARAIGVTASAPNVSTVGGTAANINPITGEISPAQISGQAPTQVPVQTQSQVSGQAPSQTSQMPSLQYPVRREGQPFTPLPTEAADTEAGNKYVTGLINRQVNLPTAKRNIDEVIRQAEDLEKTIGHAGFIGSIRRNFETFLGTDEGIKYKELSKDLANAQIANIQAKGGSLDTVAGQELTKAANGDITYPPEVLKNIARRTQADMQGLDLEATAAQKFVKKYGANNIKSFQQTWANNANTKVFEAMHIYDTLPAEKAKEEINKLFSNENEKTKQELVKKLQNIRKLERDGTL